MIAMPQRRTITGMLTGAGVAGVWHHSKAYGLFGRARWCVDQVGVVVTGLIVSHLLAGPAAAACCGPSTPPAWVPPRVCRPDGAPARTAAPAHRHAADHS
jgi:hypothetical protein